MAGSKPIRKLIPLDFLREAAECLRCIAHPARLRIIEILLSGEFTVEAVARLTELPQPVTSTHLRLMQGKGLLASERRGRSVYYRVAEPQLKGVLDCVRSRYRQEKEGRKS